MSLKKSLKSSFLTLAGATIIAATSYGMLSEGLESNRPLTETSLEMLVSANFYPDESFQNQLDLQEGKNLYPEISESQDLPPIDYLRRFPDSQAINMVRHTVNNGESLYAIASRYLDSNQPREIYPFIDSILEQNQKNNDIIHFGETLILPIDSNKPSDLQEYSSLNFEQKVEFFRDRTISNAEPYIEDIIRTSEYRGIDARLPMAIASVESQFVSRSNSSVGARGIWQLMPQYYDVSYDEIENLGIVTDILTNMYHRFLEFHGDSQKAIISTIAGYNVGPNRVMQHLRDGIWDGHTIDEVPRNGNPRIGYSYETRNYVRKVIERLVDYGVDI